MHVLTDRAPRGPVPLGGKGWSELALRTASAAVVAPVALACIWRGGIAWTALVAVAAAVLAAEWIALARRAPRATVTATTAAGLLYIGLVAAALLWLRADQVAGRTAVLFVILVIWASDIGAYAVGRTLGGPRLAPAISPSKTWAGAMGALVAAGLAGGAVAAWWVEPVSSRAVLVALLLSAAGQTGDLLESAMKRRFGVKDTSRLIPGHGGLLDRLDSLLVAAPVAAGLAVLAGRGVVFFR